MRRELRRRRDRDRRHVDRGRPAVLPRPRSRPGRRRARDRPQPDPAGRRSAASATGTSTSSTGTGSVMTPTQAGLAEALDKAMNDRPRGRLQPGRSRAARKEATIIRQGKDRILVQVPGLQDPGGAEGADRQDRAARVQAGRPRPPTRSRSPRAGRRSAARSCRWRAAAGSPSSAGRWSPATSSSTPSRTSTRTTSRWSASASTAAAASAFARVTQENVGKPFAIILDNVVLSAPNINEPILGGQAQISGSFTVETANELAIQLRSGRLPVELKVVEERTVGPDLGRDSIRKARHRRDRRHRR